MSTQSSLGKRSSVLSNLPTALRESWIICRIWLGDGRDALSTPLLSSASESSFSWALRCEIWSSLWWLSASRASLHCGWIWYEIDASFLDLKPLSHELGSTWVSKLAKRALWIKQMCGESEWASRQVDDPVLYAFDFIVIVPIVRQFPAGSRHPVFHHHPAFRLLSMHSDSAHLKNWTKIFHCLTSTEAYEWMSKQMRERSGPHEHSKQCGAHKRLISGAKERASGWARGSLLKYQFQEVLNHCAMMECAPTFSALKIPSRGLISHESASGSWAPQCEPPWKSLWMKVNIYLWFMSKIVRASSQCVLNMGKIHIGVSLLDMFFYKLFLCPDITLLFL